MLFKGLRNGIGAVAKLNLGRGLRIQPRLDDGPDRPEGDGGVDHKHPSKALGVPTWVSHAWARRVWVSHSKVGVSAQSAARNPYSATGFIMPGLWEGT